MKKYTLISCVGTGMYKKEGGYRKTVYQFPDKKKSEPTSLFLKAILEIEYRPIKKIILIGTFTSSWDMLIPDSSSDSSLWERILGECSAKDKGISSESIRELKSRLPVWYNNIPFEIIVHTSELNQENVERVFSAYMSIPNALDSETDILFDITHGFRSMPLLMFQSLQLNASKIVNRKVQLIYGEYIDEEKISYVRNLSEYWNYYEISSAMKLFYERFDGKSLAEKVNPYWESGAKCLRRLSEIVECNFSLQVPDLLKQIKNALDKYTETEKPQWVNDVWNMLNEIYIKLTPKADDYYPNAKIVWEYSKLLREKDLITQAVIALQVTVETAITEKFDSSKIGDYEWFNGYINYDVNPPQKIEGVGRNRFAELRKKDQGMSFDLGQLERLRNQIAHGGGKDKKGNNPHQANIPGILKSIDNAISSLFNALNEDI